MSPGQSLEMGCSARDLSPPPTTEFVTVNSLCLREKVLRRRCDMASVSGVDRAELELPRLGLYPRLHWFCSSG